MTRGDQAEIGQTKSFLVRSAGQCLSRLNRSHCWRVLQQPSDWLWKPSFIGLTALTLILVALIITSPLFFRKGSILGQTTIARPAPISAKTTSSSKRNKNSKARRKRLRARLEVMRKEQEGFRAQTEAACREREILGERMRFFLNYLIKQTAPIYISQLLFASYLFWHGEGLYNDEVKLSMRQLVVLNGRLADIPHPLILPKARKLVAKYPRGPPRNVTGHGINETTFPLKQYEMNVNPGEGAMYTTRAEIRSIARYFKMIEDAAVTSPTGVKTYPIKDFEILQSYSLKRYGARKISVQPALLRVTNTGRNISQSFTDRHILRLMNAEQRVCLSHDLDALFIHDCGIAADFYYYNN
ncbi:hypothetical protein C8J56DRAFT_888379 [Mycena floridula]|nr:hypothetical protein C8J56DRAFT_888379 [Mycena floridula]